MTEGSADTGMFGVAADPVRGQQDDLRLVEFQAIAVAREPSDCAQCAGPGAGDDTVAAAKRFDRSGAPERQHRRSARNSAGGEMMN